MTKILIVGGVAGGASAAARARRLDEHADIIMFEKDQHISFANCGFPYHISGDIEDYDALLLQTPQSFNARFKVDVRVNNEVIAIDKANKTITVKDHIKDITYQESYDKLLLSPGAAPFIPPINGIKNDLTFSLRTLDDMTRIINLIKTNNITNATVCGGGFIGLEMVEALVANNIKVSLVELANQVMPSVDIEMAQPLAQELQDHGVTLYLEQALQTVVQDNNQLFLTLDSGTTINSQLLIMAVGVRPNTSLADMAHLELGETGAIKVNAQMQTSDSDIYAVGDAVQSNHFVSQSPAHIPLAGPANRQGRIAGENMLGGTAQYQDTQGTAICKVFDYAIASVGLSEKALKKQGIAFTKVYLHGPSHAAYYPGACPISLKLMFCPTSSLILGAQAVGKDGIDKRIDILSVAQRAGMTVEQLQHLELSYAPPFGSAKDIINQAGFVATNVQNGSMPIINADELVLGAPHQSLIDIRNPAELAKFGTIAGAINIPVNQLRDRINELPKDQQLVIICQVGLRGHVATRLLKNLNFDAVNLTGGFKTWLNYQREVVQVTSC
ncbi:MAG: FAD-dependent oxidoreductase [Gammaproteobacteria bacterium]|nr:FAD-dependent oxidoreductase [Gammaproteobacteria bacterium]